MVEEGYLRGGSTAVRQLLTAFKLFNPARHIPFRRKSNIPPSPRLLFWTLLICLCSQETEVDSACQLFHKLFHPQQNENFKSVQYVQRH